MSKTTSFARRLALGARALALAAGALTSGLAWAVTTSIPAQVPLVSRVSTPPPPSVMITIDDSGSMQAHFMPESSTTVNGATVSMPVLNSMYDLIDVFYGDQQKRTYFTSSSYPLPKGIAYSDPNGNSDSKASNVFQRQMRSSDVNSIFYNPTVLYKPWVSVTSDSSGHVTIARFPDGAYTNASWNPADPTIPSVDLSRNLLQLATTYCPDSLAADCVADTADYDPALYYVLTPGANPLAIASYTAYDLNTTNAAAHFPSSPARLCSTNGNATGCCASATYCTVSEDRANFANWFVYYHTRTLLMKGAMAESLSTMSSDDPTAYKLRVGFGTINTPTQTIDGYSTSVIQVPIRNFDSAQLNTVVNGILGINPYGGTPLRLATSVVGSYFALDAMSQSASPWRTVPGTAMDQAAPLACRRAYELLTTDGYYNDTPALFGHAGYNFPQLAGDNYNIDGNNGPTYGTAGVVNDPTQDNNPLNPLGYSPNQYVAAPPYSDTQSDMLADYAMAQYVVDLQPNLVNIVPQDTANGDLAYWQHLNMFTVGLGVTGQLNPATSLPGLTNGTIQWDSDRIDDLWHAALDTHGAFFSAKDITTLTAGLTSALGSAAASSRSESGAATAGTSLISGLFKYVPEYSAGVWSGQLLAYQFSDQLVLSTTATWDAGTLIPAFGTRKLYTWNGSASVPFSTSMPSSLKNLVDPVSTTQNNLINYIAGDRSNEGPTVSYRQRVTTTVLGDITDSPPTYVLNVIDMLYGNLPTGGSSYATYLQSKGTRKDGLLMEGANDGMLHVFDAVSGVELYGYVPYAVLGNLANYASQPYGSPADFHQDYVDGPQTEADAYIATRRTGNSGWSDLVLGSFGAGAPGFYALDVTNFTFDDKTLLWEIDGGSANPDVGYITSNIVTGALPATAVLGNGNWKAFVGNGVDSVNGNAVLFVVNLSTGAIDASIKMPDTNTSTPNGLTGVTPIYDGAREVVGVYAGDLHGNIWRVDFVGTTTGAPAVGFVDATHPSGGPLFTAVDANGKVQPITAPPAVYPRITGNVVLFGTGKLIDAPDADNTDTQSFYGVWDPTPANSAATGASPFSGASPSERSKLVQQTITTLVDPSSVSGTYFTVSANPVSFSGNQLGWYMDLATTDGVLATGNRVIYAPLVLGQWVLINAMKPGSAPTPQSCQQSQGTSTYFLLPAETGALPTTSPVWDVDGNGTVDSGDSVFHDANGNVVQAGGYSITSSGGQTNTVSTGPSGSNEFKNVTGSNNAWDNKTGKYSCIKCTLTRVWRQLMTPPF